MLPPSRPAAARPRALQRVPFFRKTALRPPMLASHRSHRHTQRGNATPHPKAHPESEEETRRPKGNPGLSRACETQKHTPEQPPPLWKTRKTHQGPAIQGHKPYTGCGSAPHRLPGLNCSP